jgi:hypothetical protein
MNIMLIRSQVPALLVAPPAGQQRVCHCCGYSQRARGTFRRTTIDAEVLTSCCPSGRLSTGIDMRVRQDRPQSP